MTVKLSSSGSLSLRIFDDQAVKPNKIAHNSDPNSCYLAVFLNTMTDKNLQNLFNNQQSELSPRLRKLKTDIMSCISKVTTVSDRVFTKAYEGVVSVGEIKAIQGQLAELGMIVNDNHSTDQDPIGVLQTLIQHIDPRFTLFRLRETKCYEFKGEAKRRVQLSEEDQGPSGEIILDEDHQTETVTDETILSLSCEEGGVNLEQAMKTYLKQKEESGFVKVYKKVSEESDQFDEYNAKFRVRRQFISAPSTLILQLSGIFQEGSNALNTVVTFQTKMKLIDEGKLPHYYLLKQVNCHTSNHEYVYLKSGGKWFLSDDMLPIKEVSLSAEADDISRYGRTFIYEKVNQETFKSLELQKFPALNSLELKGQTLTRISDNREKMDLQPVIPMLEHLIYLCSQIVIPGKRRAECLLRLSWGIIALPKQKKFSSDWKRSIVTNHWLLLEDISRTIGLYYPEDHDCAKVPFFEKAVPGIVADIATLQKALESFLSLERGMGLKSTDPILLPGVEKYFYPEFDRFVLQQVEDKIAIIEEAVKIQEIQDWLNNPHHVKALFRVVEVIGEASKILSRSTLRKLPTLYLNTGSGSQSHLWGKLRNVLHHNKSRCWDVIELAHDKWLLVIELIIKLKDDVAHFNTSAGHDAVEEGHLAALESLYHLCKEKKFDRIRKKWEAIEDAFEDSRPLKRVTLGFEDPPSSHSLIEIWSNYGEPHLKKEADNARVQLVVMEILRFNRGCFVKESDIQSLSMGGSQTREEVAEQLKKLVAEFNQHTSQDREQEIKTAFEGLARQFVFFKPLSKKGLERDTALSERLIRIIRLRAARFSPIPFSPELLKNSQFGALLSAYIELKYQLVSRVVEELDNQLSMIAATWPKDEIDRSFIDRLLSSQEKLVRGPPLNKELDKQFNILLKEKDFVTFIGTSSLLSKRGVAEFPVGRIIYLRRQDPNKCDLDSVVREISQQKEKSLSKIDSIQKLLREGKFDKKTIEARVSEKLMDAMKLYDLIVEGVQEGGEDTLKEIKGLFETLAFTDKTSFIQELDDEGISHGLDQTDECLYALRTNIEFYLEAIVKKDCLEDEIDHLVAKAEDLLGVSFVQKALRFGSKAVLSDRVKDDQVLPYEQLFKAIYLSAVGNDKPMQNKIWENIPRKMRSQRLSPENMDMALQWIDDEKAAEKSKEQAKGLLKPYLNGEQKIAIGKEVSPAEHDARKVQAFEQFLEAELFDHFPGLKIRKSELCQFFRIAYAINEETAKTEHYADSFERQVQQIGKDYQEFLSPDQLTEQNRALLLSIEYDMQNIGEIAEKITRRPSTWEHGRHILSLQHLRQVGLLRKMMAHYPLSLHPESVISYFKHLAFETANRLLTQITSSYRGSLSPSNSEPISYTLLRDKMDDIRYYLDQFGLGQDLYVLSPNIPRLTLNQVDVFGHLTLMLESTKNQKKGEFVHSLIELELVLSYEMGAHIKVVGKHQGEFVNIPANGCWPVPVLHSLEESKQTPGDWIHANQSYDIFLNQPWFYVVFKSGLRVSYTEHVFSRELRRFLNGIGFGGDQDGLGGFLENPNLSEEISRKLSDWQKKWKDELFWWTRFLFEQLPPPGTEPHRLIALPSNEEDVREIVMCMQDTRGHVMKRLSAHLERREASQIHKHYYKGNKRLDYFGHYILDENACIPRKELSKLAEYASRALKAHMNYIKKYLCREYVLDHSRNPLIFHAVERVEVCEAIDTLLERQDEGFTDKDFGEIHALIKKEAHEIKDQILAYVDHLCEKYGERACLLMLDRLEIDKKIEQMVRSYYHANKIRLKRPFIRMTADEQLLFNDMYHGVGNFDFRRFPFVESFIDFLEYVSFQGVQSVGPTIIFSENFKKLVPEEKMREQIRVLLVSRERIKADIRKLESEIIEKMRQEGQNISKVHTQGFTMALYQKMDALFRMVHQAEVVTQLKNRIRHKSAFASQVIVEDFLEQYQDMTLQSEIQSIAGEDNQSRHVLWDLRSHFKFRFGALKELKLRTNFQRKEIDSYRKRWKEVYEIDSFSPLYTEIVQTARHGVRVLINGRKLPVAIFEEPPSLSDLWKFINRNTVKMSTIQMGTLTQLNFNYVAIEKINFNELFLHAEDRDSVFETNPVLYRLVEAYFPFSHLERELAHLAAYLLTQEDTINQLQEEKRAIEERGETASWRIKEFDTRIKAASDKRDWAHEQFKDKLSKIQETRFYKMLTLQTQFRHIMDDRTSTEEEWAEEALHDLIDLITEEPERLIKHL